MAPLVLFFAEHNLNSLLLVKATFFTAASPFNVHPVVFIGIPSKRANT